MMEIIICINNFNTVVSTFTFSFTFTLTLTLTFIIASVIVIIAIAMINNNRAVVTIVTFTFSFSFTFTITLSISTMITFFGILVIFGLIVGLVYQVLALLSHVVTLRTQHSTFPLQKLGLDVIKLPIEIILSIFELQPFVSDTIFEVGLSTFMYE